MFRLYILNVKTKSIKDLSFLLSLYKYHNTFDLPSIDYCIAKMLNVTSIFE